MSSYDALASSYDGLMADGSYLARADYLCRAFGRSRIPVTSVLDLACGTGTIACLLAQRGYQVTATDASEEMLTQAVQKAAVLDTPPLFLLQSMPRLHLLEPVDAVVSTLDSLNYLTRVRDLQDTFKKVFGVLKPGGAFIFDVNTPYKLRRMDHQMYMDETEDSYCVWRTFFSEKTQVCTYQVDLFHLLEDDTWVRDYEEHRERAWSEEQIRTFLEDAGFENIKVTGDMTRRSPKDTEDRWVWRCEKPMRG